MIATHDYCPHSYLLLQHHTCTEKHQSCPEQHSLAPLKIHLLTLLHDTFIMLHWLNACSPHMRKKNRRGIPSFQTYNLQNSATL